MKRLYLLLLFTALILSACSSQKVAVTRFVPKGIDTIRNEHYSNYWSAMACGMPELSGKFILDDEKKSFSQGLLDIKNGNLDKAENIFSTLIASKNDTIKDNSKNILAQLYVYGSKWKDFLELLREKNESDTAAIEKLLPAAYIFAGKESFHFGRETDTIPIKIKNKSIYISVKVNGKDYEFLFDTGADFSLISESTARDCGIKPLFVHDNAVSTSTGNKVDTKTGAIDTVKIGSLRILNHPSVIVSDEDTRFKFLFITFMSIDGIIGWNAIKNMDVEIDTKNMFMVIRKPVKRPDAVHNMFWLGYPTIKLKSENGIDLLFGFDSGADKTKFTQILLMKLAPKNVSTNRETFYGIGGKTTRVVRVIPKLNLFLKDYMLEFTNINSGDQMKSDFVQRDGCLGLNICLDGKFRIDATNGEFTIEK